MKVNNNQSDIKISRSNFSIKNITSKVNEDNLTVKQSDIILRGDNIKTEPTKFMTKRQKKRWLKMKPAQREKYLEKAQNKYHQKHDRKNHANNRIRLDNYNSYNSNNSHNSSNSQAEQKKERIKKPASFNHTAVEGDKTHKHTNKIKTENINSNTKYGNAKEGIKGNVNSANATVAVGKKVANQFGRVSNIKDQQDQQKKNLAIDEIVGYTSDAANSIADQQQADNKVIEFFKTIISMIVGALTAMFSGFIAILAAIIAAIIIIISIIAWIFGSVEEIESKINGGTAIVQVALAEEGNTSGEKFWKYTMGSAFANGNSTPWCASFVSWCANECGYIDSGLFPKYGSVTGYMTFFESKGQFQRKDVYTPKTGDLIVFKNGISHIGIVQYVENGRVVTIEGNTSDKVASRTYSLNDSKITGYCTPDYPDVKNIDIPEPYGTVYTYMGWQTITSPSSAQYKLRQEAGMNFDDNGFAKIDNRYVVACTTTFGTVGDYVDWYLDNGEVIHAVIGDIKNQNDAGCNEWGHQNGACVIEFVVDKTSWYGTSKIPTRFHPEWGSRVIRSVKSGGYWN